MLFNLRTTLIALAIGILLGGLTAWHFTAKYKDATWEASIAKQKSGAATELQAATERAIKAERAQNELSTQLEVQHVESQKQLDNVLADNRKLSAKLGGLRDPGRRASCSSAVPASTTTTGRAQDTTTDSRLSNEASGFLLEFARDADRAAEYANTCHNWVEQIGKEKPQP